IARIMVTDDDGGTGNGFYSLTIATPDTLYVSATTGSQAGDGSRAAPFLTLERALEQPVNGCARVMRGAVGSYTRGTVPGGGGVGSQLTLEGGLDPYSWTRHGFSTVLTDAQGPVFVGLRDTRVSWMEFDAPDATGAGAGSMALLIRGCASLAFTSCRFVAGK